MKEIISVFYTMVSGCNGGPEFFHNVLFFDIKIELRALVPIRIPADCAVAQSNRTSDVRCHMTKRFKKRVEYTKIFTKGRVFVHFYCVFQQ